MPSHAFVFVQRSAPSGIDPPRLESPRFSERTVIEQPRDRPMVQPSEPIAAHRPSRLFGNAPTGRHHEFDAIARCQVDRGLLFAHEKTIGDEIHARLSNRLGQCKIDAR